MANDQGAAAGPQGEVEFDERLANEIDAAIAASVERIENLPIKDEDAMDSPPAPQRLRERGMIVITQVAAKPDQN
jgi:hypothetical protein